MKKLCFLCKKIKNGSHKSYCRSCYNGYKRTHYAKNRKIEIDRSKEWNKENRIRHSENVKKSRENNVQHYRDYQRERRRIFSDKYKVFDQNNRIKRKLAKSGQIVTFKEWVTIIEKNKGRCFYCRKKKQLTMDHFMPLSKGGKHVARNIVPACRECNSKKYNKLPEDYLWEIGAIPL